MCKQINVPKINQHTTLSSLLAAALADARRIQSGNQNDIQLDMSHWFMVHNNRCYVCLAGAMLCDSTTRHQLESQLDLYSCVGPETFDLTTRRYLRSLDYCRVGAISNALQVFFESPDGFQRGALLREELGGEWPSFEVEPSKWWAKMDELVRHLHKAGL